MQKSLNRNPLNRNLLKLLNSKLSSLKLSSFRFLKFLNSNLLNIKRMGHESSSSGLSGFLNRKVLFSLIFVAIAAIAGMVIPPRISITMTPSLDKRVFFLSNPSQETKLKRGDYVMFTLSTRYINNGEPIRAIKKVGCAEGDTLTVKWERHYYCNNLYMGYAKEKSKKGEPVEAFSFNGKIPDNMLFVIGDSPDSYDSKYFGFIRKEEVIKIAYPIF